MCGIAGIVNLNKKEVDPAFVLTMLEKIKHRGPDDEGIYINGHVGLGHVRLSILDLSAAGHQPMVSEDKRFSLVFNGEIYNYLELKNELRDKYNFTTKTDTEVLLAAYIIWGEACLNRLNGDFAFVIYDSQEDVIFGARDRFGIKPFYYTHDSSRFIFASEIKALLPHLRERSANNKSIFEYLVYNRTDQSEETFFDAVFKLMHGHQFRIFQGKLQIKKWYTLEDHTHFPTVMQPEEYRNEFGKALNLRLRSDVPIGVCLSGGIDSSAITSMLYHDFNLKDVKTFSATFEKGTWADESPFIDAFKGTLKNMHNVTPSASIFYEEFIPFIVSQSEPIPNVSPYAQYKVMQLAQGNVVVTLDGQGADEMLAGYNYFFGSYFKELLQSFQIKQLLKETHGYYTKNVSKEAFSYFLYYMLPTNLKEYAGRRKFGSTSAEFYAYFHKESSITKDLYASKSLNNFLIQHFEYKLEHLLKWDDLNSMHFSLESRVPFLDHNLVEKTLSLPSNLLLKNGISKNILRESVKDILPSKIYTRYDKKGFSTPADQWFRTPSFVKYINELLNSSSFKNRGYFDIKDCKEKYKKHLEGKADLSKDIWKWINLEVWFQKCIEN